MADAPGAAQSGDPAGTPELAPRRPGGLTGAEAARLLATDACRADTCSPWEASPIGVTAWLLWRAILKGFRPVWLIASLLVTVWFGAHVVIERGGIAAMTRTEPGLEARIQSALAASVPDGVEARDYWVGQMSQALDGDARRRADLDRFRAWAVIGPDLIGRDRLALQHLAGPAGPAVLNARLSAAPPWVRDDRLAQGYRELIANDAARQLDPPQLVFAPPEILTRQAAAQFHWSIAEHSANAFFSGRLSGQFELTMVPGLVVGEGGDTRLYGGVRQLYMQACAREPQMKGCETGIVPPQSFDPVRYALAALEAGVVDLNLPTSVIHDGAQVLQAARESGRVQPELEAQLRGWVETVLPPDEISAALQRAALAPDFAFSAPGQAQRPLAGQIEHRSGSDTAALSRLLDDLARIRRTSSAMTAIRVVSAISELNQADYLVRISNTAGDRLLALHLALGEGVFHLLDSSAEAHRPTARSVNLAWAGLLSTAIVLFLTLVRLATSPLVRRASRLTALDARLSRLFLGRKS
ncbi:hypothetical protein [uncultured Maricaulis sp.]|uniref:hypothetical protein n=1 Tax=uncultured Maricaulis sp. TaxID=174710 RepID=UPI0030D9F1EC